MNVTKIIVVEDATYAVGERKPNDLLYIHSFIPQFKDMTFINSLFHLYLSRIYYEEI